MSPIELYVEGNSSVGTQADNELLDELERETNLRVIQPKMVSGRVQGAFLTLLTKILNPRTVLEIGTFTGYSALSIAAGLSENSEIHTVEIDDELEDIARSFFARSPHGHKISLHIGSALELVPQLVAATNATSTFDLVYIDGDKREYPDYYRMIMGDEAHPPMVHPGTIILTDNVLWYGKVVETTMPGEGVEKSVKLSDNSERNQNPTPNPTPTPTPTPNQPDKHTAGITLFNRLVAADRRVENVILPLRDGLNLIRVK